jgi:hypothetical protein
MGLKKKESNGEFPPEAYLLAPDRKNPSTWQFLLWESLEKKATKESLDKVTPLLNSADLTPADRALLIEQLKNAYESVVLESMSEIKEKTIAEYHPSIYLKEAKLDRDARTIRNTVLISERSLNGGAGGRKYSEKALRQITQMAEGMPAYANHVTDPKNAFRPRDVKELIGKHTQVRYDANTKKVYSILVVLESQVPWVFSLAEDMADIIGNSVVSRGLIRMDGDMEVVEEILAVRSGDLVSDPGATKGLFEHREAWENKHTKEQKEETVMNLKEIQEYLKGSPAESEALKLQLAGDLIKENAELKTAHGKFVEDGKVAAAKVTVLETTVTEQKLKIDAYESADKQREKDGRLAKKLGESALTTKYKASDVAISAEFRSTLSEAAEEKWDSLIADRVKILDGVSATTTIPTSAGKPSGFMEAVHGEKKELPADAHKLLLGAL